MPRLFFALWPTDPVRDAMAAHREAMSRDMQGRATRPDTLHLTLVFVGNVPDLRVPTLLACGDRVRAQRFQLTINRSAAFARAKVGWLGCTDPPPALFELQTALQEQVEGADFALNGEGFQPHVTMARHCERPAEEDVIPAIHWQVESFVLLQSQPGPGGPDYRVLRHWALDA